MNNIKKYRFFLFSSSLWKTRRVFILFDSRRRTRGNETDDKEFRADPIYLLETRRFEFIITFCVLYFLHFTITN